MKDEYIVKDDNELILNSYQLREWKEIIIEDYKKSEYPSTLHRRARRKGFIEAVDGLKQWIINEAVLDPEPCCHGVRICNIINKLDKWKEQEDKRFVLEQKHLIIIKQMLREGYSKQKIADELQVSIATIVYWTNPYFRRRQMEKNRTHKFNKNLKPVSQTHGDKK